MTFETLVHVARDFSPRLEAHGPHLVVMDASGLQRLFGAPGTMGNEIRRAATADGVDVRVAIAVSRMTAVILAHVTPGLTVVPSGGEARALARVPLKVLERVVEVVHSGPVHEAPDADVDGDIFVTLRRWGLKTLGDLAALPSAGLSERLGQRALFWQRLSRGEDDRPLVPTWPEERFEESLDLEWPIEGLEPLSFVLGRLFDALCARLERRDRGAAALHLTCRLVTRALHERSLQLPTPLRDARVLRTLVLLDLESHPPEAGIDRVTVVIDPTPARVLQFSLLARAIPSAERMSTLLARLAALMGERRVGAPRLVDSYRPGAFEMVSFLDAADRKADTNTRVSKAWNLGTPEPRNTEPRNPETRLALRRLRLPIPARVLVEQGRPARLTTDRRGFGGGVVVCCAGPWRTSGEWWRTYDTPGTRFRCWDHDEWDVALSDGAAYRIYQDRELNRWFIEGSID